MFWHRHFSFCGARVNTAVLLPAAVAVVLLTSPTGPVPVPSARGLVEWMALALLAWVAGALVHTSKAWRAFIRHDAIKADIAATGGLGKRLMV